MDKFVKWQEQDAPEKSRAGWMLVGALIFPTAIPALLIWVCPLVDRYVGIGSFYSGLANIIAGIGMVLLGGAVAIWTIVIQIALASGTPFPMLPTKKLLIVGPFLYCRNPMTLGTVIAYAGIAVWVGSFTALVFVAVFAAALITYLKLIEEKELALRFGSEYLEYKKSTPFIIPIRIRKQ
jgi:protein-S-isoprenylcysteine O-methyltransferase Ste14